MKHIFFISIMFFLVNCSKPKIVFICGDHECINKTETEHFFNENLTLEVKIIASKPSKEINLVELNLEENNNGKKKISVLQKTYNNEDLKTLTDEEISIIKENIKKKKDIKVVKKIKKDKKVKKNLKINPDPVIDKNKTNIKNIDRVTINNDKPKIDISDVCTILEKCSIDEISKYLIDEGKKKKYPNLTIRQ